MPDEKVNFPQNVDFNELPNEVLVTLFYSLDIKKEKEKSLLISIIKILYKRNKLNLIINSVSHANN